MSKYSVILLGLLLMGCSNDREDQEQSAQKRDTPNVILINDASQISPPKEELIAPEPDPQSTFTIKLDSSTWIVYNDPEDKTQNADTLRLYPDSTYTVNEFAWYFKEKYDEEGAYYWTYEGTYSVEGDILNLYTQSGREKRNHSSLLVSDTTLQYTMDKSWGGPLRRYIKFDLVTPAMKLEHKRLRNNLKNFLNADGFTKLNAKIDSVEDVIRIFGAPIEVMGSLNERIAQEDPYNTHSCVKFDGLTIQLIGSSLWLYEYSKPAYDIDSHITIGMLKDSVFSFIGEPGTIQYDDHWYSSDLSDGVTHAYVTGDTEYPFMEQQNQLFAIITYDDLTNRINKIRFEQIYIKPH